MVNSALLHKICMGGTKPGFGISPGWGGLEEEGTLDLLLLLGRGARAEVWKEQEGNPNLRGHSETGQWVRAWESGEASVPAAPALFARGKELEDRITQVLNFITRVLHFVVNVKGASRETLCLQKMWECVDVKIRD